MENGCIIGGEIIIRVTGITSISTITLRQVMIVGIEEMVLDKFFDSFIGEYNSKSSICL